MPAQKATSEPLTKNINGKDRIFRTITTAENGKVTNKRIVEEIIVYGSDGKRDKTATDKLVQDYKSSEKSSDLVTDINGKSYVTVRNDNKDTIYTDLSLRKEFVKTGQTSITHELNDASINALTNLFTSDQQASNPSFWQPQFSTHDNIASQTTPADLIGGALETLDNVTFGTPANINITPGFRRDEYEDLFYPLDILRSTQDRIKFQMEARSGRSITFSGSDLSNPLSFGERTTTTITGSVLLPIQGGVQDSNTVNYTESRLNPVTGLMAAASMDPTGAAKTLLDALRSPAEDIQAAIRSKEAQNIINVLRVYLAQSAVGGSGLIPRTTGAILNPNMELLLNSPALRNFTFSFTMSARSAPEATQIKKIIRFFKQGMSVKQSESSLFTISPNIFKIKYLTSDNQTHPSIGQIKECALTALNTNYTPDGTYMTYDDPSKTMTSYQINMQFTELEPLTENDYQGVADSSIGF
jgi:hypothetical protein|tara:strand:+ start:152 stop:1564 length:1413 start_codon:yes stop_codon:yes gene_type:complete